jgi:hypothetical protein
MQELIDKLAKERKEHLKRIESITINDIKKLVSRYNSFCFTALMQKQRNYVPRMKTKEELALECGYKHSWAGGSNKNTYFNVCPIMKPKVLDSWTMHRVQMPERSYEKFINSNSIRLLTCVRATITFLDAADNT